MTSEVKLRPNIDNKRGQTLLKRSNAHSQHITVQGHSRGLEHDCETEQHPEYLLSDFSLDSYYYRLFLLHSGIHYAQMY